MTSQRDLKIAIIIMIISLIAAIICYAAPNFDPPAPDEPLRIMFQNSGGKVLFTHDVHAADYTGDCEECHHEIGDTYSCSECHEAEGDEDVPSRADAFHDQCKGCHEDAGAGPIECAECHLKAQ